METKTFNNDYSSSEMSSNEISLRKRLDTVIHEEKQLIHTESSEDKDSNETNAQKTESQKRKPTEDVTTNNHSKRSKPESKGEILIKCTKCGKECKDRTALLMHVRRYHEPCPHSCDVCGKGFAFPSDLEAHKRVHTEERPFACEYDGCYKRFAQASGLNSHMRLHTGELSFICKLKNCTRKYNLKRDLNIHYIREHPDSK